MSKQLPAHHVYRHCHDSGASACCGRVQRHAQERSVPEAESATPLLVPPTDPETGKNWHDSSKKAFRPKAGLTSYTKRVEARKHHEAVKEREREMKEEREAERQVSFSSHSLAFYSTDLVTLAHLQDNC